MRETQAPTGGEVRGWQREALPLVAARIPARARCRGVRLWRWQPRRPVSAARARLPLVWLR